MGRDRSGSREPRVRVFETASLASVQAARVLAATLRVRRNPVLVLASGRTMVLVYRSLVRLHRKGRAPFRHARTFNLDELAVPAADPRSFRTFMERRLFRLVDLDPSRIHSLRGNARDAEAECRRYEGELARYGPPDLALVGIGANGHVAYLEPGLFLPPRAAPVRLSVETRRGLARDGVRPVPRRALTMGLESILAASGILLVATGRAKAAAIARALDGPVTPACPASYLSLHPALTVLLDREAAGRRAVRRKRRAREREEPEKP